MKGRKKAVKHLPPFSLLIEPLGASGQANFFFRASVKGVVNPSRLFFASVPRLYLKLVSFSQAHVSPSPSVGRRFGVGGGGRRRRRRRVRGVGPHLGRPGGRWGGHRRGLPAGRLSPAAGVLRLLLSL